jgi:hypothetical protein
MVSKLQASLVWTTRQYGDYDTAMKEWVRLFPDQIPFTISESDRSTVAYFRYAEESGKFVDKMNNYSRLIHKLQRF